MKNSSLILFLMLLLTLTIVQVSGQSQKMSVYRGDNFTIEYPSLWQTTNEKGILNFFPEENYGAVTFSAYSAIDFPLEKTKDFILDMNERKDSPDSVKMTMKGDIAEFYYEFIDDHLMWVTKVFRRKTNFYLLTINCQLDKWNENKASLLKVLNSFKLN